MLIKKPDAFRPSEITPEAVYLQRRTFIRGAGLGLGAMLLPGMGMAALDADLPIRDIARYTGDRQASMLAPDWLRQKVSRARPSRHLAQEPSTPWDIVTSYNNFYEFYNYEFDIDFNLIDYISTNINLILLYHVNIVLLFILYNRDTTTLLYFSYLAVNILLFVNVTIFLLYIFVYYVSTFFIKLVLYKQTYIS